MKNLLERFQSLFDKIKSLDKKILIGAGAGIVALIVAVVVILVVCLGGKDTDANKDDTYKNDKVDKVDNKDEDKEDEFQDEKAAFIVKVVDQDGNPVAGVVVQVCKDECVPATTDETGIATFESEITEGYKLSVVTCPEGYEYTGEEIALEKGCKKYELKIQKKAESSDGENNGNVGGLTTNKPGDVNGVEQNTVTTKPNGEEIFGAGSKDEPYLETPVDMTVTTIDIPAGKTVYYSIYRVGGKYFTINDSNVSVVYNKRTYAAKNGKVSFKVRDGLASHPVEFQIKNNGSTAKSFVIKFSDPQGSWDNPEALNSILNKSTYEVSLASGNEIGYYYSYKVEKSGTIRFYVSGTAASSLEVQNNDTTGGTDGASFAEESNVKTDEQGRKYIEMAVTQGQILKIHVGAEKVDGAYPATKITWEAKYV